jgi:hypothetical protein
LILDVASSILKGWVGVALLLVGIALLTGIALLAGVALLMERASFFVMVEA